MKNRLLSIILAGLLFLAPAIACAQWVNLNPVPGSSTAVVDGDKGEITVSGGSWTIDDDVLDFTEFKDTMTLDANFTIGLNGKTFTIQAASGAAAYLNFNADAGENNGDDWRFTVLDDGGTSPILAIESFESGAWLPLVKLFGNTGLAIYGKDEDESAILEFYADQGDDNNDDWRLVANPNNSTFDIETKQSGSWADALTLSNAGVLSIKGASTFTTSFSPVSADGGTLGTADLEISDIFLAASGVIYGENDQSNTLTSSATGWTANLDIAAATFTVNSNQFDDFLDEDDMSSDSETALASQQSIKAYVDTVAATKAASSHGSQHEPDGSDPVNGWYWAGDLTVNAGVATVAPGYIYHTSNLSTTTITDFQCSGGGTSCMTTGESRVRIFMDDPDVTVDFSANANIEGNAGVDYTGSSSDTTIIEFLFVNDGSIKWQSVNLNSGFSNSLTFSAKMGVGTYADADGFTMSAYQAYNYMIYATGAGTITLPEAASGMNFCVEDQAGGAAISLEPNQDDAGDVIRLNGVAATAKEDIDSDSTAGALICCEYYAANTWACQGDSHWAEETP